MADEATPLTEAEEARLLDPDTSEAERAELSVKATGDIMPDPDAAEHWDPLTGLRVVE